jgi:hypothetical protein
MSTIPPDSNYLLSKARSEAEQSLIESVKQRTRQYIEGHVVESFRIKARAYWIAKEVFDSEYETSLGKVLSNPDDKKLLAAIYKRPLIRRLIDESTAVLKKALESQAQSS